MPDPLALDLLGGFRLRRGDQPLPAPAPRLQALVARLALHPGLPQPRAHLAALFWPDTPEAQARTNLRKLVGELRHLLPDRDRFLITDGDALAWRDDAAATCDVVAFLHAAERAQTREELAEAMGLYVGDLLPGGYDDWLVAERERLRQVFASLLERALAEREAGGDFAGALEYARRLLALDSHDEPVYRHVMRLHALSGDRVAALRAYRDCARVLERELGVRPDHATRALLDQIRAGQLAAPVGVSASPPALGALTLPALPNPTSPLLGRADELAAVTDLLQRDSVRLVTLTGAGGSGKTRLALALGWALEASFSNGVAFVSLAPISDPDLVLATIARALGIRETLDQPLLATLRARLQERQILLVLDNFEQVLPAAPHLVELLAGCPGLKVLVTSRAALRLSIEQEYPVRPLAVPDPRQPEPLERIAHYPSVALFTMRAQAVQPDFAVTTATAPTIAKICQRLDGLPLAIELAAARIRLLSPEAMLARLEQRLPLLSGGARDLPERQRTLRATLDWSYVLLAPGEQALFARLGVFVDGFTLEAAEAVGSGGNVGDDILDRLDGLVSQSLVQRGTGSGNEPRFVQLETIREYALERLAESGEIAEVRRAHGAYFLALAEEAEPGLRTGEQDTWVNRLEAEYGNLRAVLERTDSSGDVEGELRLSAALWWFWWMRAHLITEGRRWLERALARGGGAPPGLRAKALGRAGALAWVQSDYARGRALLEQSLAIRREIGDQPGTAEALNYLGNVALEQADYASARRLYDGSLTIRRELGDQSGVAASLGNLGIMAEYQGNATLARALYEESLAISRELGDRFVQAITLGNLGSVALMCDEYAQARTLIDESRAIRRQLGDEAGIANCLELLGTVAWAEGSYSQARSLLEESQAIQRRLGDKREVERTLPLLGNVASSEGRYDLAGILYTESLGSSQDHGDRLGIAQCLEGLAGVAAMSEQRERAARLTGAAEALRDAIGTPAIPAERRAFDRTIATLRESLGDDAFEAERAVGRAMPVDLAIDEALDVPAPWVKI